MDAIAELYRAVGPWALSELLKATALLLLVFAGAVALRRASAGVRHLLWSAAVVAVLALPLLSVAMPWRVPVLPTRAAVARIEPTVAPTEVPAPAATVDRVELGAGGGSMVVTAAPSSRPEAIAGAAPAVSARAARRPSGSDVALALLVLWAVGACFVLIRLAVGAVLVRRIVAEAEPLATPDWTRPLFEAADRLDLPRAPALLQSDRMPMPFASGVIRPAIVLPASATGWSDRRRRAVLVHELAHVRRFDLLMNVLGRLACALYWFHPLVWLAARRMRADSERAADDTVLSVGTRASEYADHLLQIVCAAGRSTTPAVALPMAQRKEFEGRMLAILEANSRRSSPSRRHALAMAALALALVLPTAALAPATAAAPTSDSPSRSARRQPAAGPSVDATHVAVYQLRAWRSSEGQGAGKGVGEGVGEGQAPAGASNHGPGKMANAAPEAGQRVTAQDTGSSRLIAALAHALSDPAEEVRENAAYALGAREAPAAVPALTHSLRADEAAKVREMAAWALGQIEQPAATSALGEAARLDGDASVRATAVWALGQIGQPGTAAALTPALADRVEEVRARAAWALGKVEPKTAPTELVHALRDPSPAVRMRAAWAIGQIEDASAATALTPLVDDSSADVRKAALWAISRFDSEAARSVLIRLLDSKDADVRTRAVRALAGHGGDPWPWPWPQPRFR